MLSSLSLPRMPSSALLLLVLLVLVAAVDARSVRRQETDDPLAYAPVPGLCPSTPLVRNASGVGSMEAAWLAKKQPQANAALKTWLKQFGTFEGPMPQLASAVAGGFLRASMLGAGIHQQLDRYEGKGPMAGLLQAITYETTLSGSTAYQIGLMQNNWPSIASLSDLLWQPNYAYGMVPAECNGTAAEGMAVTEIVADMGARSAAGFPVSTIDIFGRIIGYSNLYGPRGGVETLLSGTRNQSKFANAQIPFPIMTSVGTINNGSNCHPGSNATQYEFSPFEFGSWDQGVAAFMDMKYLGTAMNDGSPAAAVICTTGFDNMALMSATSSNTISKKCENLVVTDPGLSAVVSQIFELATFSINRQWYSAIPNPFFNLATSPMVSGQPQLALVDGGDSGQVIPLWPLLYRPSVDVTFVWDNYYDAPKYGTTGGQLVDTYQAAMKANLKRMPTIPPKATFRLKGLNMHPVAFGCNDKNVQTFIYVPYQQYIKETQLVQNLTTTPLQTRDYVLDGNLLATNNGNSEWPQCVACLIMKKTATKLPSFCSACYTKYCYN